MIKEIIEKWEKEEHKIQYINSQKAKLIISFIQDLKVIQNRFEDPNQYKLFEETNNANKNV